MYEEISNINDLGFAFIFLMGVLIFVLPRRYAVIPVIMTALYMTLGQVIIVATLHASIIRIIILVGLARVLIRGEIKNIKLHVIDYMMIAWILSNFAAYYLLRGTTEAFINRLGYAYNTLGTYFLLRCLIHDHEDVFRIIKIVAVLTVPLATLMVIEYVTGRNMFSLFGGVPEMTAVRHGKMRCQGAFSHPILAGTYGATTFPLFAALWIKRESKLLPLAAFIASIIIIGTSGSSGPFLALIVAVAGLVFWNMRAYLKWLLWGGLATTVALHLAMKAPVWALIGKASELTGGTGWHRVELINQAINRIDEWWLFGTDYTRHWMPTGVTYSDKMTDITSMYVRQAVDGGLITLLLFITLIYFCFRCLGKSLRNADEDKIHSFAIWCLGCSLLTHVASFISVQYFDQIFIFWCLIISFISTESMILKKGDTSIQTTVPKFRPLKQY